MIFKDRRMAGEILGYKLRAYGANSVVYALPRGGVEVGVEVARLLQVPLGLIISRKIGHPDNPEYAIGAVAENGKAIWNEREFAGLGFTWKVQAAAKEQREARRRRDVYLADRNQPSALGKTAIIVDDGIATGLTARAAIRDIKKQRPAKTVIAAPVASADAVNLLLKQADEVITLDDPANFRASVGTHYKCFPQLSDEEVISLLNEAETSSR